MAENSIGGALVPSVKADSDASPFPVEEVSAAGKLHGAASTSGSEVDKDLLCPICIQMIKDAFLTACGHSFCYMCIATHVRNKNDCPCCGRYLTMNLIFPNFSVDKLLRKISEHQIANSVSCIEQLCQALSRQDFEVSIKDLDSLLSLLAEKKSKMKQEEAETNLKVLLEFLVCLRKKKMEMLNEIQNDLHFIKEDINAVQERKLDLLNVKNRYVLRLRTASDLAVREVRDEVANEYVSPEAMTSRNEESKVNASVCCEAIVANDVDVDSGMHNLAHSERFMARKRQIEEQFHDLQECYLHKRRLCDPQSHKAESRDLNVASRSCYHECLEDFQYVLSGVTRYSQLRVISEMRHGDAFHSLNVVSSIEFDRDDELFATAGVSRQIKVFELSSMLNEPAQTHCAVVDIGTRSKLSCLSWNKYTKHYIASSDYEGIVTVWDVTTRQSVREFEEHEKRAWSVDFSRTEPSLLLSGGDDGKVKVWSTKQEESVLTINMNANVCSVKCNPTSSMHVAVGSADHHVHYYDLRKTSQPLHVFSGHRKAVSYVRFLSSHELASASTDSTLRLWDVKENLPVRAYRGHMNEKNFVGLTANNEYLSCGSESNEVFVYHKAISKPVARYRLNMSEFDVVEDDRGSFISAICWKNDSSIILAANSQGTIKVLALDP